MSLGAGQIIFLAGINATENKVSGPFFYPWNEFTLCTVNIVERSTIRIRKLFLFTGCLCYNSSSDAVFLHGRFLLDADRGNLSLLLCCESLQHQHQDAHVSRHLMGWVYYFTACTCSYNHACFRITKSGVVIHWSVSISFLSLWVGLPVIMVAISLGIAAGKEGLQSYTSDK